MNKPIRKSAAVTLMSTDLAFRGAGPGAGRMHCVAVAIMAGAVAACGAPAESTLDGLGSRAPGSNASAPESPPSTSRSTASFHIIGYFPEWSVYGRGYSVPAIPADSLTHLCYAFAKISEDGTVSISDRYAALEKPPPSGHEDWPAGNLPQLVELRRRHPGLRVLISVGGWTGSAAFSRVAADVRSRAQFARSLAALVTEHDLDGADIDWEYPVARGLNPGRPEDRENFTLLLRDARRALGETRILTIAVSAAPEHIVLLDYRFVASLVDQMLLMSYDYHGAWDAGRLPPRHHAPMSAVESSVEALLDAGVPARKIVLGVPLYGRSFGGVASDGSSFNSVGPGRWESGVVDYRDAARYAVDSSNWSGGTTNLSGGPWLWNSKKQEAICYDNPKSVRAKTRWARSRGLGGVMLWELSCDDAVLVEAAAAESGP